MKKICIFLFSGTGMTKYVANKISSGLAEKQVHVDLYSIENTVPWEIPIYDYDAIGIAYPVHAWNAPEIVVKFAKQLTKVRSMKAFIISTCGEAKSINFASSKLLIKVLNQKGFDVFYDNQFAMPCNFMYKDNINDARAKINAINEKVPQITQDIMNHNVYRLQYDFVARVIAFLGRIEWSGRKWMRVLFRVDKSCNVCGKCVKSCPKNNISIVTNQVSFGWSCELCARCFYVCPKRAIKVRQPFKFFSFENWYDDDLF